MSDKSFKQIENKNKLRQNRYANFCDISNLVLEQWPRLTHEEADACAADYERFCRAVQEEYGIPHEEIERRLNLMKREVLFAA